MMDLLFVAALNIWYILSNEYMLMIRILTFDTFLNNFSRYQLADFKRSGYLTKDMQPCVLEPVSNSHLTEYFLVPFH